ncbi:MAG: hypothetical protein KKE51_07770 [Gammaproteobacteria bacterium]|nr:hypothetical protein [Gammaproteobacteria bacterium]MBU1602288.1 hypothetical protein [Gammaproteobacteria bacterium]MBU2433093.1 hypothetical protein [Gammaproteobacteria bacterium]MBU2451007.1 hypothetical protein [Gammaproteobacteria bacterium]
MVVIPRRVRRISANEPSDETVSQPLEELRHLAAWVLLGEPGAGKSKAFEQEALATEGHFISIAKFLSDDPEPVWQDKTLYLDGLDETRASGGDTSILLKVRAHLRKLGKPKFRIACRAADWFGSTDSQAIGDASPDGQLAVFALEPLNDSESREILRQNHGISDPDSFMGEARERGIDGLLQNPQTLRLLAESIHDGHWPNTRQETFELACKKLAEEDSKAHRLQQRDQAIPVERLMAAAGQLCAALLLSDKTGLALDTASADGHFPLIDELSPADLSAARLAVRRKLFGPSPDGQERVIPSHRSIAEFLAARWLARQIDDGGLPLRRVLSLFMGRDERTVSGLRGLYGWLALHSRAARLRLIEADPVTVVVYGDVKPMPPEDKRKILAGLQQEAKRHLGFRWEIRSATPFGAMAQQELAAEFSVALSAPERDDASQSFTDCVLDILNEGGPIPELASTIKAVAMDDSRWGGIRRHALGAWLKQSPPIEEAIALLDSINDQRITDSDDDLAGQLLSNLYPEHIAPEALLRYLHAPKKREYIGKHSMFWGYELARIAPDSHLSILLDQLAGRTDLDVSDEIEFSFDCRRMLGGLLRRGIEVHGDAISDERLFSWLGIGADKYGKNRREKEHQEAIANWLGKRPERHKAVLALCYKRCEGSEHVRSCIYAQEHRLHGTTVPDDIGVWHLRKASETANNELAENHLSEAVRALMFQQGCAGLSLEKIEAWGEENPKRQHWLGTMLSSEIPEWRLDEAARSKDRKLKHSEQKRKRSIDLVKHLSAIRDGSAAPGALHELAGVWMDHYTDTRGETPAERFDRYCENGDEVLRAAEAGFFLCPLRDNLPSVAEIVNLSIKRQEHYIRKPCLIGMELRWQQGASLVDTLSDDCLRRMIAFRLTYGADNTPEWFTYLVRARPELVADVLIDYAGATLKARQDSVSGIYPLAYDAEYRGVAELAALPLLATFPVRAKSTQLSPLEYLLKAALRYAVEGLAELIDTKLTVKAMDVAQKVYWLTAAMLLDPPKYETLLWQYIGRNWIRANHFCAFLDDRFNGISNDYVLSPGTLGKLIELLSPHAEFERMSGFVTGPMQRGESIRGMVTRLGAQATEEAEQEIERLLALPALSKLKHSLENARHQLRLNQREGAFRFPPLASVARILANREPANAADLAALAVEYLDQLAVAIRHDNDDGFRAFWNIENKRPTGKRDENYCRDPLLTRLRTCFDPFGVDCQPEGDYANDKRADIRLSYRNEFEVPIEIKRDDNRSLWKSLRGQLMSQYTVSPKTSGYGIYLVLWFGLDDLAPVKDGGKKTTSPEELQTRLEAQLDSDERRRVFVRVLDVSWPK